MSRNGRLWGTALLFLVALGLVALSAATEEYYPLFIAWVPLLAVPWVLTRPEPTADREMPDDIEAEELPRPED